MGLLNNLKSLFGTSTPQQTVTTSVSANITGSTVTTTPPISTEPQPTPNGKKIMIVEDETVLADALEIKFKHEGFEVFKAANGQIGLDMIEEHRPDIVLLDLMMPVMDGKTMLRKMREIPDFKYTPVVILTNAGEVDNIRETKQYDNASAFLIKSNINPEDAVKVVKELLRV